jgi:hypothetical protein
MKAALLALALVAAGCTAEQLRENQQGWRRAECDKILDTHTRERCLKEVEGDRK